MSQWGQYPADTLLSSVYCHCEERSNLNSQSQGPSAIPIRAADWRHEKFSYYDDPSASSFALICHPERSEGSCPFAGKILRWHSEWHTTGKIAAIYWPWHCRLRRNRVNVKWKGQSSAIIWVKRLPRLQQSIYIPKTVLSYIPGFLLCVYAGLITINQRVTVENLCDIPNIHSCFQVSYGV